VCTHDESHAINVAVVHREPYRRLASRYGVSEKALRRHSAAHIPELLVKARDAVEKAAALNVLDEVRKLFERVERNLDMAERGEDWRPVVAFAAEARKDLELAGRLLGDVEPPSINIVIDVRVQGVILEALAPYPDARLAVADALRSLEGNGHDGG
jgi:hypothetical protein